MVGFETPRGWHERRYSEFYSRPGLSWSQPGRVRLFYNGIKQNEVIWTDFGVDETIPAQWFRPEERALDGDRKRADDRKPSSRQNGQDGQDD